MLSIMPAESQYSASTIISKAHHQRCDIHVTIYGSQYSASTIISKAGKGPRLSSESLLKSQYSASTIISKVKGQLYTLLESLIHVAILCEYDYIKRCRTHCKRNGKSMKVAILCEYDYIKSFEVDTSDEACMVAILCEYDYIKRR